MRKVYFIWSETHFWIAGGRCFPACSDGGSAAPSPSSNMIGGLWSMPRVVVLLANPQIFPVHLQGVRRQGRIQHSARKRQNLDMDAFSDNQLLGRGVTAASHSTRLVKVFGASFSSPISSIHQGFRIQLCAYSDYRTIDQVVSRHLSAVTDTICKWRRIRNRTPPGF
jgi:hypothetical protein